ncbi:MAG: thioredoxin domain-containing protein [Bdellovibrionota bacterium]
MANELSKEKSPYLQQHAHNPVHWKPWGEAAFKLAQDQDLPIFLSIGYSTCHWCHVMERESFERKEIADFLNKNFVSIKVDREELPEVDALYMEALQIMTSRGGWPLNIFLDHKLQPYYGGSYFPPQNFFKILHQLDRMWRDRREELTKVSEELKIYLTKEDEKAEGINLKHLKTAFIQSSEHAFDPLHGGHKGAPKFPMNYEAIALLRFESTPTSDVHKNVEVYLEKMLSGGIWDHVGGGIHRYSTDEEWRVPHFEKMLYDQASLLSLLTECLMKKENPFFRTRAESLISYLERNLKMPNGAFYTAEDADSEGEEGKFYIWTHEELSKLLTPNELKSLSQHFEISPEGNWEQHIVFHSSKKESEDYSAIWSKLLGKRSQRERPLRDEKILTSWNGLMISALARYARTTDSPKALELAKEAADFVLKKLYEKKKLMRRWIDGEAKFEAQLEDYAFLIEGLYEIYLTSMELKYLKVALELQDQALENFWKDEKGFISNKGESVWRENQEFSDNVVPSAVSSALLNLAWLSEIALRNDYASKIKEAALSYPQSLLQYPLIYPRVLEFYDIVENSLESIAVVISDNTPFSDFLKHSYNPKHFVIAGTKDSQPLLKDKALTFSPATYYICKNRSCSAPQKSLS